VNSYTDCVITGQPDEVNRLQALLKKRGWFYQSLPMTFPIHSQLLSRLCERLTNDPRGMRMCRAPVCDIISPETAGNVRAELWPAVARNITSAKINWPAVLDVMNGRGATQVLYVGSAEVCRWYPWDAQEQHLLAIREGEFMLAQLGHSSPRPTAPIEPTGSLTSKKTDGVVLQTDLNLVYSEDLFDRTMKMNQMQALLQAAKVVRRHKSNSTFTDWEAILSLLFVWGCHDEIMGILQTPGFIGYFEKRYLVSDALPANRDAFEIDEAVPMLFLSCDSEGESHRFTEWCVQHNLPVGEEGLIEYAVHEFRAIGPMYHLAIRHGLA